MFGGLFFALLQAVAPSAAASAETSSGVIVNPDWQRRPTSEDIGRHYPKAASDEDLAGRAVLSCSVNADGGLTACKAEVVNPEGAGFGEAAVAMSGTFRMRPQTRDGRPVAGGTVRIPITFIIPANLRTSPVRARHPDVVDQIVELDCRFKDLLLDNCFVRGAGTDKATEVALKIAEKIVLPGLPTRRRQGRIVVPLVFTNASGVFSPPTYVTQPRWRERPTSNEVFRAYPPATRGTGMVGKVVLECGIEGRGELRGCTVYEEDPSGAGFGASALGLTPKFRLDEVDNYGFKVDGRRIRIPIRFSPALPPTN